MVFFPCKFWLQKSTEKERVELVFVYGRPSASKQAISTKDNEQLPWIIKLMRQPS
jgi:hypothetical protein